MEKISGVYQITNEVTGDYYVGSSKNVMERWASHRRPSTWKQHPNSPLYKDMQEIGLDKFKFQILVTVEPEHLKEVEQEFIEMLHPSYNSIRANGVDVERRKETIKKCQKEWCQSDKGKESKRKRDKKYKSQPCSYNGETLTLRALVGRFQRAGIEHPTLEAKKYLSHS